MENINFFFFSTTNNILPPININGTGALRKKKFSTCSVDVNSDKLLSLSCSLSPHKQRSTTPPPKNHNEFINLPQLNSEYSLTVIIQEKYKN